MNQFFKKLFFKKYFSCLQTDAKCKECNNNYSMKVQNVCIVLSGVARLIVGSIDTSFHTFILTLLVLSLSHLILNIPTIY